mmetsp:Transcript_5906/g.7717  ORF Transcript_5906/g.7717 Transcript_5906/m.7717 type:complete len:98 (+) Transcript_5906:328-621(+)
MRYGGGDQCRQCSKPVYFAERLKSFGEVYHKACFKCQDCNRTINAGQNFDRDNTPYCRTCYVRNYGPTGFRGGVTGGLMGINSAATWGKGYEIALEA